MQKNIIQNRSRNGSMKNTAFLRDICCPSTAGFCRQRKRRFPFRWGSIPIVCTDIKMYFSMTPIPNRDFLSAEEKKPVSHGGALFAYVASAPQKLSPCSRRFLRARQRVDRARVLGGIFAVTFTSSGTIFREYYRSNSNNFYKSSDKSVLIFSSTSLRISCGRTGRASSL